MNKNSLYCWQEAINCIQTCYNIKIGCKNVYIITKGFKCVFKLVLTLKLVVKMSILL